MGDNRQKHDEAGARACFEGHADRQAIEKAMKREAERADETNVVMMARRIVLFFTMYYR